MKRAALKASPAGSGDRLEAAEAFALQLGIEDIGATARPMCRRSAFCAGRAISGFSVDQMRELLALWRDDKRESADVKRLAPAHVAALDAKTREIAEMSGALRRLAEHCEGNHRPDCPIIDLTDLILEKPVSVSLRDVA